MIATETKILRVMTFNIAHGRGLGLYQGFVSEKKLLLNLRRIGQLVTDMNVDIVALQEVDEDSHWNRNINLLRIIQEECGLPYAEMGINNRRTGRKPLAYGNALLSRYPFRHLENNPFGKATLGGKGFLYAEVDVGGHSLPLINLHLDYRSRLRRLEQVGNILRYLEGREHPGAPNQRLAPIICGDFNTGKKHSGDAVSYLLRFMRLHRSYHIYPNGKKTFPAFLPQRELDFILLPDFYRAVHCEVLRTFLSDHRPVLLEFALALEAD